MRNAELSLRLAQATARSDRRAIDMTNTCKPSGRCGGVVDRLRHPPDGAIIPSRPEECAISLFHTISDTAIGLIARQCYQSGARIVTVSYNNPIRHARGRPDANTPYTYACSGKTAEGRFAGCQGPAGPYVDQAATELVLYGQGERDLSGGPEWVSHQLGPGALGRLHHPEIAARVCEMEPV